MYRILTSFFPSRRNVPAQACLERRRCVYDSWRERRATSECGKEKRTANGAGIFANRRLLLCWRNITQQVPSTTCNVSDRDRCFLLVRLLAFGALQIRRTQTKVGVSCGNAHNHGYFLLHLLIFS